MRPYPIVELWKEFSGGSITTFSSGGIAHQMFAQAVGARTEIAAGLDVIFDGALRAYVGGRYDGHPGLEEASIGARLRVLLE